MHFDLFHRFYPNLKGNINEIFDSPCRNEEKNIKSQSINVSL